MYSQKRNCPASVLDSIFLYLWAIYIFPRSAHLFSCSTIHRQTDRENIQIAHRNINVGTRTSAAQFHFGNVCFEFSVYWLCSALGWREKTNFKLIMMPDDRTQKCQNMRSGRGIGCQLLTRMTCRNAGMSGYWGCWTGWQEERHLDVRMEGVIYFDARMPDECQMNARWMPGCQNARMPE